MVWLHFTPETYPKGSPRSGSLLRVKNPSPLWANECFALVLVFSSRQKSAGFFDVLERCFLMEAAFVFS
jgi:hypothetical protein